MLSIWGKLPKFLTQTCKLGTIKHVSKFVDDPPKSEQPRRLGAEI